MRRNPPFSKETRQKLAALEEDIVTSSRAGDLNRARSFSVGTAFGGATEVSMRANDGRSVWVVLQPVEVIEFIHQLAANVGCHIHVQPREDFSSWRSWNPEKQQTAWAPMGRPPELTKPLPPPEKQPGMQPALMAERTEENVVATKKTVDRRSVKRTAKAS